MEIDVRQRRNQRNRRRERAQRMQAERDKDVVDGGGSAAGAGEPDDSADEDTATPPVREKPPQRRKKQQKDNSPLLEEDIIDGFAILAFKTYEDLEVSFDSIPHLFIAIFSCKLNRTKWQFVREGGTSECDAKMEWEGKRERKIGRACENGEKERIVKCE